MEKEIIRSALYEAIRQRRSTRTYLKEPVPEAILNEVIEAGRYAPSASNSQATHFYVFTGAEKLAGLRKAVTAAFAGMTEQEGMSPVFQTMIKRAKEGEVDVAYGAPALIVTTSTKGSPNSSADCACALQNMMLTASANQLANVWINQFYSLRNEEPVKAFFASIGVTEKEELCGALALGYSEKLETTPLPRTGFVVTYLR